MSREGTRHGRREAHGELERQAVVRVQSARRTHGRESPRHVQRGCSVAQGGVRGARGWTGESLVYSPMTPSSTPAPRDGRERPEAARSAAVA